MSPEQIPEDRPESSGWSRHGAPPPLVTAAGLVLVEGLMVLAYGVLELVNLDSRRLVMGATTAVFFAAYGALLLACSFGLSRMMGWSRGPVLLAQLVMLGLAWNFKDGGTWPIALVLALVAALVLLGLLHPRSVQAWEGGSEHD